MFLQLMKPTVYKNSLRVIWMQLISLKLKLNTVFYTNGNFVRKETYSENIYKGTENIYKETENIYKGTENIYKGTENIYKRTENIYKGTGNIYKETENIYRGAENITLALPTSLSYINTIIILSSLILNLFK